MPTFPNVPFVSGVPPLLRNPLAILPGVIAQTRDLINFITGFLGPPWGLFLDGFRAIDADTVVSFDYNQNWNVANYPLERGAFESYDKVQTPFAVKMRFASGGSEADRQALLTSVERAANSLNLYDAVTPERVYRNVNVNHYDYKRYSNNGVGLLVVDVWCVQVRVEAQTLFTNTKSASAAATTQGGTVQAVPATDGQVSMVGNGGFF